MGLFSRLRAEKKPAIQSRDSGANSRDQEAVRLIEEGNAFEQEGQRAEALQRYDAAVGLSPDLARAPQSGDAEDYVARAIAHTSDLRRLASLRQGLRSQVLSSPIFDTARFAEHFATALRGMWQSWCGRQPAAARPPVGNAHR
jgi:hypothetical protein